MELLLLKISIIKTTIRVLTFCCIFLPIFVSPFYTDVPDLYYYFVLICMVSLVIQINFIPRYKISGKVSIDEIGITIQSTQKIIKYHPSDIKRIDIEYNGYRGGEYNVSVPTYIPLVLQEGINTLYIETVQGRKDWIYFLSLKNVKKDLFSLQSLFLKNGVDFRLIIN